MLLSEPDFLIGNLVLTEEVLLEDSESTLLNGVFYFLHKPDDEAQVVDSG